MKHTIDATMLGHFGGSMLLSPSNRQEPPSGPVTISWEAPDEHRCAVMRNRGKNKLWRTNGLSGKAFWYIEQGNDPRSASNPPLGNIDYCPWCGEKLP